MQSVDTDTSRPVTATQAKQGGVSSWTFLVATVLLMGGVQVHLFRQEGIEARMIRVDGAEAGRLISYEPSTVVGTTVEGSAAAAAFGITRGQEEEAEEEEENDTAGQVLTHPDKLITLLNKARQEEKEEKQEEGRAGGEEVSRLCGASDRSISHLKLYHISKCGGSMLNAFFREGLTQIGKNAYLSESENSCDQEARIGCGKPDGVFLLGTLRTPFSFYMR